jgi:Uma2 family endonuclease
MSSQAVKKIPVFQSERPIKTFTLEQYLHKEAKSEHKHEFINGQIIKMPYAKGPHNIISANIMSEMIIRLDGLENDFIVFSSDQKIYFDTLNEGVYADALAVCDKPIYYDTQKLLLTNPIIVVEVLSRSTSSYDRNGKFDKYKTLPSLREYVMIRQDACYAEVWFRERPGFWHETIVRELSGKLPLQSVGIELFMNKIYRHIEL